MHVDCMTYFISLVVVVLVELGMVAGTVGTEVVFKTDVRGVGIRITKNNSRRYRKWTCI